VNKAAFIAKIIAKLDEELALYARSAIAAHAEATDEQSKAENKYDTRGLEASYLARGQSKQVAETLQVREQFVALPPRDFAPADPIDLGALIEVTEANERSLYFIGPGAGGTEISHGGEMILVITPQSPLGQQLLKRRQGERLQFQLGGRPRKFRIVAVT